MALQRIMNDGMGIMVSAQSFVPDGEPRGGTCAAHAVMHMLGISFKEASEALAAETDYTPTDGVSAAALDTFLKARGFKLYRESRVLSSPKARTRMPRRCVVLFMGHVAYYESGVIYDCVNTFNQRKKCIAFWA